MSGGMVYSWKPKSNIKIDAQLAGETVEMLRERLGVGVLSPADLLSHARDSNSPLHDGFEWDDGSAGEQYRLQQAGHMLRSLTVTVSFRESAEPKPVRAFVNVTHRGERGYTSMAHAMSDAELRAQVIAQAWCELLSWRQKYGDYSELAKIHAAIDADAPKKD